jgi:FkbM family methyltransferase
MPSNDSMLRRLVKPLLQRLLPDDALADLKSVEFRWRHRLRLPYEAEATLLRDAAAKLGWISRSGTVLDVGANIGQYSALLSELVGPTGTVHALEPMPHVRHRLERNLAALGCRNVRVYPVGAADRAGGFDLFTPVRDNTPLYQESSLRRQSADDRVMRIETRAIDELELGDVTFAKFDIEGAEYLALQGATRLLDRARPVLMLELEERFCERFGHSAADVGQFLARWSYRPFALRSNRFVQIDLQNSHGNVFFLPEGARRPA